jgi:2-polyprenyl-6-methoxyphenol hydroxylase-like FAD-dependent oxidoreductase
MGPEEGVLIVGAGPAGLMLAGDLAEAGIACTMVERREGESQLTRQGPGVCPDRPGLGRLITLAGPGSR